MKNIKIKKTHRPLPFTRAMAGWAEMGCLRPPQGLQASSARQQAEAACRARLPAGWSCRAITGHAENWPERPDQPTFSFSFTEKPPRFYLNYAFKSLDCSTLMYYYVHYLQIPSVLAQPYIDARFIIIEHFVMIRSYNCCANFSRTI